MGLIRGYLRLLRRQKVRQYAPNGLKADHWEDLA